MQQKQQWVAPALLVLDAQSTEVGSGGGGPEGMETTGSAGFYGS